MRDVTAGGCTYCSSPSSSSGGAPPRSAAVEGGREGLAGAIPGIPCRASTPIDSVPQDCLDRPLLPSPRGDALRCPLGNPLSTFGPGAPKPTASHARLQAQLARTRAEGVGNRPLSPPSSGGAGPGWNREWCRSVDAWCRNASARFRARQAGEVVRSARRLHWLAGCNREGALGVRSRVSWPPIPSETVGAEGWAALAAFGDVADLLEIVGSTAELVVSVTVDSAEQQRQLAGQEDAIDDKTDTQRPKALELEEMEGRQAPLQDKSFVSHGEGFLSERENETSKCDSTDATASFGNIDHVGNNGTPAEEGVTDAKGREHRGGSKGIGATNQGKGGGTRSPETARKPLVDPAIPQAVPRTAGLSEATKVVSGVAPAKCDRRPASSRSTLIPVDEEGDTDMESSSEDVDGEEDEGGGTKDGTELSPEITTLEGGAGEALVACETEDEAAGNKREDRASMALGDKDVAPKRPLASARIILGPEMIAESLEISPLSAFVLQAARRSQHRVGGGVDDACEGSQSAASATSVPSSPGKTRENVSKQRWTTRFNGMPRVDKEAGPVENDVLTSSRRPGLTAGSGSPLSPQPSSVGGGASACEKSCMWDTEKTGLACAVETCILPRIRISSTSKRHKTRTASAKRDVIRLRLDNAAVNQSETGSKDADTAAASAAQASGVTPSSSEAPASAAAEVDAGALEAKVACARRYAENPIHRWVGRVDGRRCLLSCSAAQPDCASTPVSTRFVGLPPGRRGQPSSHEYRAGKEVRSVYAMFALNYSVDGGDVGCRLSPKQRQKQRFVVAGQVPLTGIPSKPGSSGSATFDSHTRSAPFGFALGRPLCRNCGRRALQRLLAKTILSTQSEVCLSPYYPGRGKDPNRLPANEGSRYADGVERFAPARVRREKLQRGGRLADPFVSLALASARKAVVQLPPQQNNKVLFEELFPAGCQGCEWNIDHWSEFEAHSTVPPGKPTELMWTRGYFCLC